MVTIIFIMIVLFLKYIFHKGDTQKHGFFQTLLAGAVFQFWIEFLHQGYHFLGVLGSAYFN